jgi:hypothetical protein
MSVEKSPVAVMRGGSRSVASRGVSTAMSPTSMSRACARTVIADAFSGCRDVAEIDFRKVSVRLRDAASHVGNAWVVIVAFTLDDCDRRDRRVRIQDFWRWHSDDEQIRFALRETNRVGCKTIAERYWNRLVTQRCLRELGFRNGILVSRISKIRVERVFRGSEHRGFSERSCHHHRVLVAVC